MRTFLKIHSDDKVAVALRPLASGSVLNVDGEEITLLEDIPQGHKFALCDIRPMEQIIKYGAPIGVAKEEIRRGAWIHTHNMKTGLGELLTYTYEPSRPAEHPAETIRQEESLRAVTARQEESLRTATAGQEESLHAATAGQEKGSRAATARQEESSRTDTDDPAKCPHAPGLRQSTRPRFFQGYRRPDGRVGVRNEIWIIPTVGCVNNIASAIERRAQVYKRGSIDAIAAFPHPYGCSQMGEDQENTRRVLADLVRHPNAGGVLVLGLGCENSGIDVLKSYIGEYEEERVRFLICQESEDEIGEALEILESLADYVSSFKREAVPCGELIVGMKCGGSDGLSGITANPTVGAFSDLLIAQGGTTILTEVPEMFGAETLLMNRCETRELFDQTVALINDFKNYFTSHNQTIYENPSPGNKKGGISTLEDKSLGCTQKSGSAPVRGVLSYGAPVEAKGLNLLSAPGNDLVASTALAASGAHIVLFTTGRGTPFASPVPTVKISSNTPLYEKKGNWIDFNCGSMVEGIPLSQLGQELFDYVLEVASGRLVKSEEAGYHDMAIFKQGVTL